MACMIFLMSYDRESKMICFRGNGLRTPTLRKAGNIKRHDFPSGLLWFRDVAQLVARTAGGREVAGSSPVIPTTRKLVY